MARQLHPHPYATHDIPPSEAAFTAVRLVLDPNMLILASYFVLIAALFGVIARRSIPSRTRTVGRIGVRTEEKDRSSMIIYAALAGASLISTWTYMIKFMFWSYQNWTENARLSGLLVTEIPPVSAGCVAQNLVRLERVRDWLQYTSLFDEAWMRVVKGTAQWWWSSELCALTVGSWALFLWTEGRRLRIPYVWAYMALGQVVAISVAQNLFHLALSPRPVPPVELVHRVADSAAFAITSTPAADSAQKPQGTPVRMARSPSQVLMPPPASAPEPRSPSGSTTTVTKTVRTTALSLPSEAPLGPLAIVWFLIIGGFVSVWRVPDNLSGVLVMHAFPLLALIPAVTRLFNGEAQAADEDKDEASSELNVVLRRVLRPSHLHFFLGMASLVLKLRSSYALWAELNPPGIDTPYPLIAFLYCIYPATFHSHPAQSSISSDVVCATLSSAVWMLLDHDRLSTTKRPAPSAAIVYGLAAATPLWGPSATLAFYLAMREDGLEQAEAAEEETLRAGLGTNTGLHSGLVVRERRTSVIYRTEAEADTNVSASARSGSPLADLAPAFGRADAPGLAPAVGAERTTNAEKAPSSVGSSGSTSAVDVGTGNGQKRGRGRPRKSA